MARTFTKNTANYLALGVNKLGALINGASGISVHCWALMTSQSSATDGDDTLFIPLNDTTGGIQLRGRNVTSVLLFGARSKVGDPANNCKGATTLTTGIYYPFGGSADFGAAKMKCYVNGAVDGTNNSPTFGSSTYVNGVPTTWADGVGCAMTVGGSTPLSTDRQLAGNEAEVAIWKAVLTDAEFAALAKGVPANQIRPASLVFWMPLKGDLSPEPDFVSHKSATITGTVAKGAHAPINLFTHIERASAPLIGVATGFTPAMRRTLSRVGTRVGARQSQNWGA